MRSISFRFEGFGYDDVSPRTYAEHVLSPRRAVNLKRRAADLKEVMTMSGFFTLIAENILVIIGFAIYGVLVYYMVAKAIRRYTGGKSRRGSEKMPGRNKSISEQDSTEANVFFTMFRNSPEKSEEEDLSRKDFSRDIPTANSYRHRRSQQD
jgi:hypothetical protein